MSTSSGPIIVTDVTIPVTPAVIRIMGSGLMFMSGHTFPAIQPSTSRAVRSSSAVRSAGRASVRASASGRVQRPVADRSDLAGILDRIRLVAAVDQARPELGDHDAVAVHRRVPRGLERPESRARLQRRVREQAMDRGQAHQRLRADRGARVELPRALDASRRQPPLDEPPVADARAGTDAAASRSGADRRGPRDGPRTGPSKPPPNAAWISRFRIPATSNRLLAPSGSSRIRLSSLAQSARPAGRPASAG